MKIYHNFYGDVYVHYGGGDSVFDYIPRFVIKGNFRAVLVSGDKDYKCLYAVVPRSRKLVWLI